ncbi:hypothetical protein [Ilumatobacter nonamiensis]|uniref:hypothetical protein n=1 Tax=Ilumatobacter nonamiensis TaxID=467093 RepID=UPI0003482811|nr:hypothetical protein [Ilumatobacter nonamiensis]
MKRSICSIAVAAVLLAACGSSDDADTTVGVTESAPAETAPPATEAVVTTEETTTTEAVETTTPEPESTEAVPESTESEQEPSDASGADMAAEEQAAADAWSIVFDSTAEFADKETHLADAAALQATLEAYTEAGSGFGGISLVPTAVAIDGETAAITYDVNFGENPAYEDQAGSIGLVDGVWIVDRDEFCAFMSSARVSCP